MPKTSLGPVFTFAERLGIFVLSSFMSVKSYIIADLD